MKILDFEQGTKDWKDWRKTVITATDCPAILGSSPWVTPYKCWQKKLSLIDDDKMNEAMERGVRLEPKARDSFINKFGMNMTPKVIESTEYNFLGASLDGLSDCGRYLLEIKCGGSKLHTLASQGEIPEYYKHQIQHQLLVTGADYAFYYSFDGEDGICIEVFPDPSFAKLFIPLARDFLRRVAYFEPPEMKNSDYKDMDADLDWNAYSKAYKEINEQIKVMEETKEFLRKKILELCGDQSCVGGGIKVCKTVVKGRIAYEEIPEIKGMFLDKYRKKSSEVWKIMVDKPS